MKIFYKKPIDEPRKPECKRCGVVGYELTTDKVCEVCVEELKRPERCEMCKFVFRIDKDYGDRGKWPVYRCRRYPPFTSVESGSWCGEFITRAT
jgi:hypothetical protein